eukprot:10239178-Alexandrium_andersonii.AAC.1
MVAFELPDVGLAREYMNFQNSYIQTHGTDDAVPPMLVAQSTWTKQEMMQCIETIVRYGRPTPARYVVIAFKRGS